MCHVGARQRERTLLVASRETVAQVSEVWNSLEATERWNLSQPVPTRLEELGLEFRAPGCPQVAVLDHLGRPAHAVAHELRIELRGRYGLDVTVEPDHEYRAASPSPLVASASALTPVWNQALTSAHPAGHSSSGAGKKVAVLDTGLDMGTNELVAFWQRLSPVRVQPADHNGHGTAVGKLILHFAPSADLYGVQVLGPDALGSAVDVLNGLIYALMSHEEFDVVHASLTSQPSSRCASLLGETVAFVRRQAQHSSSHPTRTIVAAAGNNVSALGYPALLPEAHVVGADDWYGMRANYSPPLTGVQNAHQELGGDASVPLGFMSGAGRRAVPLWGTSFAAAIRTGRML